MITRLTIVQCVQHQIERLEKVHTVIGPVETMAMVMNLSGKKCFNVSMVDLRDNTVMFGLNRHIWIECQSTFAGDHCFRFAHMFFVEQKLAIQIADIDRIQINLLAK